MTEAGGESASEYESDHDESLPVASRKEGEMFGEYAYRKDRIFKYITIQDKNIKIPDLKDSNKLTLFMELDEVLLHTFICDENFGYISNPAAKDPEHEFFMEEIRQPVLVYMRDHWQEFVTYLKENEKYIDPIVYTQGLEPYTNHLLNIIDPDREVFKTVLYSNACYLFQIKEENLVSYIKDISRFHNRDIRRSALLDPKPINFMMTPENSIPVFEYTAEYLGLGDQKDPHLISIMEELDDIKDLEDVRPALAEKFNVR